MNVTNGMATQVATRLTKEGQAFDPAMIMVILQIIQEIMKAFQECKKTPADALLTAQSPTLWDRLGVRVAAVRTMGHREFMRAGGSKLVSAILEEAKTLDVDKMTALYDETD